MKARYAIYLSLFSGLWTAGCDIDEGVGPCPAGARDVSFARYFPSRAERLGKRNFTYSYGAGSDFAVEVTGTETVPYSSGSIVGSTVSGPGGDAGVWTIRTHEGEVKVLGVGESYYSADVFLWDHPDGWRLGTLCAPGLHQVGRFYRIPKDAVGDPTQAELDVKTAFWVELQDVTVPAGTYENALVLWFLDKTKDFADLDFHGKDLEHSIALPASIPTRAAITGLWIYGIERTKPETAGPIAIGEVDPDTGELSWLAVLVSVESP